jgi:hypothetical protein
MCEVLDDSYDRWSSLSFDQPILGRLLMSEKANGRKTKSDDLTKILRMRYEPLLDYWTIKTTAARTAAQLLPRTP